MHTASLILILQEIGFKDIEVRHLSMVDSNSRLQPFIGEEGLGADYNENIRKLNDLLFSYQDYAIIATK
ncbi:hypothetical protein D3C80_2071450 [compost metagenome]